MPCVWLHYACNIILWRAQSTHLVNTGEPTMHDAGEL